MGYRSGVYIVESGRSIYERSEEHLSDAEKNREKSHIFKHWAITHPEMLTQPVFVFKVLKTHKTPLDRQIHAGNSELKM